MKKTIIQRIVFLLVFAANVLLANAQAYEFECEYIDKIDAWYCHLGNMIKISDKKHLLLQVVNQYNHSCIVRFILFDYGPSSNKYYIETNKTGTLKLYLSNGEILTTTKAGGARLWIETGAQNFMSSKQNINNDTGGYAIQQLRKYNITKISLDGKVFTTPGFRSASTIDAMCKTLMTKTGDQGQYGTSTTKNALPTTKNNTTTTTTSLISKPAVTKRMTEMQMVMYPFGVLTKNKGTYTNQQVRTELTAMFKDNVIVMDSMALVSRGDGEGYDYSYKGGYPVCTGFFNDVKLSSWSYYFDLDKASYTQSTVITAARDFMEQLRNNNFQFVGGIPSDDELYNSKLRGFGREVEIIVKKTSGDSWRLIVSVGYKN